MTNLYKYKYSQIKRQRHEAKEERLSRYKNAHNTKTALKIRGMTDILMCNNKGMFKISTSYTQWCGCAIKTAAQMYVIIGA